MENKKLSIGLNIYIIFVVSWFIHLGSRMPVLGLIRIDMLLVLILFVLSFTAGKDHNHHEGNYIRGIENALYILIAYSILTVPFVEWPGSVLSHGFINFIKAIIFYFFTVKFVRTEHQLKVFLSFFILCQTFRVLEPTYLHFAQGYWGSQAYMSDGQGLNRLAGAPDDVINPNGLAFVILTVVPFYYYFFSYSLWTKLLAPPLFGVSIYALMLTNSRSGFVGLLVILSAFFIKSKKKGLFIAGALLSAAILFPTLDADQKDRYQSIFDSDTKNAATAEGRISGIKNNFMVALRKPLFGHGLGTSREANANFGGSDQPAHNLYAEISQELGFIGLGIFLLYIWRVIKQVGPQMKILSNSFRETDFLSRLNNSLKIWFAMNLLFSLASYGLSSYEWYLFPGLCNSMVGRAGQRASTKKS